MSLYAFSLHSSRKHSEERKIYPKSSFENSDSSIPHISVNMGLRTLEDDTVKSSLMGAHLTESSSSGSITDSICTAYEQGEFLISSKFVWFGSFIA